VKEVAFPPGHEQNPLSETQLAAKFHGMVEPVLGPSKASAIWSAVSEIENDPTPHQLLGLLAR
jgi:2-methylcitrate dehydratase